MTSTPARNPDTLSKAALARALGVSPRTVNRWMEHDLPIESRQANGAARFIIGDVRAWMEERGRTGLVGRPVLDMGGAAALLPAKRKAPKAPPKEPKTPKDRKAPPKAPMVPVDPSPAEPPPEPPPIPDLQPPTPPRPRPAARRRTPEPPPAPLIAAAPPVFAEAPRAAQALEAPDPEGETLGEQLLRARIAKEVGLARKHDLDVQRRRGELVAREDVERDEKARIAVVKVGLESLGAKLRARLAQVTSDARKVEQIVEAEVKALLRAYAGE